MDNPIGSAVGFAVESRVSGNYHTGRPGRADGDAPKFANALGSWGSGTTYIRRLQTFIGESTIQELVNARSSDWPEGVVLGFRSGLQLELKLQVYDESLLKRAIAPKPCLPSLLAITSLARIAINWPCRYSASLVEQGMSVTAESCTGGLIASLITKEAGSSQVFGSGFVTYANASKQKVLDVPESELNSHGAVSEPVVRSMLRGALDKASADIGIAVSGVAGPGGGTEETRWHCLARLGHGDKK